MELVAVAQALDLNTCTTFGFSRSQTGGAACSKHRLSHCKPNQRPCRAGIGSSRRVQDDETNHNNTHTHQYAPLRSGTPPNLPLAAPLVATPSRLRCHIVLAPLAYSIPRPPSGRPRGLARSARSAFGR